MTALVAFCLSILPAYADGTNRTSEAEGFVRQVVQSLIDGEGKVTSGLEDNHRDRDFDSMAKRIGYLRSCT